MMKKLITFDLLIFCFLIPGFNSTYGELISKVKFASLEKAKELLTTNDSFTNNMSQFDIDSRLHKKNGTKEEIFKYISSQTKEWTNEEINKTKSILDTINNNLINYRFKIDFPDEIFFVKTTGDEEGGADGYTRSNFIVLKENILSKPKNELEKLIVHELFHIITRHNNKFRKDIYNIIGFDLMNEIPYPKDLNKFRITNPDAPQTDSYISLSKDGKIIECMMLLFSKSEYNGGDFFNYLNIGFLKLKGLETKVIDYVDGQPVIYTFNEISNFFEKVGKNTQYIIHPEEILAENFVYALNNAKGLPSQWIVDKIQDKLKE